MGEAGWGTRGEAPSSVAGVRDLMHVVAVLLFLLLCPRPGRAQSLQPNPAKGAETTAPVPKRYLPPPGMCRIWVDNVPANRQPAPTDCPTAIRNRPPNARVLFPAGKDDRAGDQKGARPRPHPDTTKRKPPV